MTDLLGQVLVRVNPSAARVPSVAATMSGTYGLRGSHSSASARLQQSLANRLRARTDTHGSIMFALTWKASVTPLRRQICRLVASVRRTKGDAFGSWPTATAQPASRRHGYTKTGHDGTTLLDAARMTVTCWPTPLAADSRGSAGRGKKELPNVATWATPAARDYRHANARSYLERSGKRKGEQLANQVVHGLNLNGSHAATGNTGQLNPDFSRWLMGYPDAWGHCAPMETRSTRT